MPLSYRIAKPLLIAFSALAVSACGALPGGSDASSTTPRRSEMDALLTKAHQQIEDGDLKGAEEALLAARGKDAANPLIALDLGVVYQRTGRPEAAAAEYRKVLAADEEAINAGKGPLYGTWRSRLSTIANKNLRMLVAPPASQPAKTLPQSVG